MKMQMMKHQPEQLLQLNQMKMLTLTVDKVIVDKVIVDKVIVDKEPKISNNLFKIEHLKRKLVFRCATL